MLIDAGGQQLYTPSGVGVHFSGQVCYFGWRSIISSKPACCRTDYLDKTLASLAGLSGLDQVTVYISQDGQAAAVQEVVQEYGQTLLAPPATRGFQHWQRDRVPQLGPKQVR